MDSKIEVLSLGQLISKLRKEKGFSQRKFAQISGLSNTTISRIENGETTHPDIETLKLLAAHLDCQESKLIDLVNAQKSQIKKNAKLKFLQQPVREIKRYSSVCTTLEEPKQHQEIELTQPQETFTQQAVQSVYTETERKIALKGMKLITLRLEKNVTQKELADALGLDKTLISQYEGEILKPEYSVVERLAEFFGVTVDYLIGEPKKDVAKTEEISAQQSPEIRTKALSRNGLRPEYLAIAEEIQEAGIEIEDVKAFIEMIKKYRRS